MKKFKVSKIIKKVKKSRKPIDVVDFNNYTLRIALFKGEYHWHKHDKEDEFFYVYQGKILIETELGNMILNKGEGCVIPKRIKHKPSSKVKSYVFMIEPKKLASRGD